MAFKNLFSGSPGGLSASYAPKPVVAQRAPTSSDTGYELGQPWVDEVSSVIWGLAGYTGGGAVWEPLGGGTVALEDLAADSGTAVPTGGRITIAGGANITTSAAGSTLTAALDASLAGLTSVSSTSFITSSATLGVTLSTNAITASGSDAAIDINLVPKGTGGIVQARELVGAPVQMQLINIDATNTASDARLSLNTVPAGGSPYVFFNVSTASQWSCGIDNNNGDAFTIAATTGLGGSRAIVIDDTSLDVSIDSGNLAISAAAKQLQVKGGAATDFIGSGTLVAGELTVLNTNIAAGDQVIVSRHGINGSTALGVFDVTINAGVSFVIQARNPTDATVQVNDVSIIKYMIVRQI